MKGETNMKNRMVWMVESRNERGPWVPWVTECCPSRQFARDRIKDLLEQYGPGKEFRVVPYNPRGNQIILSQFRRSLLNFRLNDQVLMATFKHFTETMMHILRQKEKQGYSEWFAKSKTDSFVDNIILTMDDPAKRKNPRSMAHVANWAMFLFYQALPKKIRGKG